MAPSTQQSFQLASIRRKIDHLDQRLLRLLNQRVSLALQIGRIKHQKKWPVYDARREVFVLRRLTQANDGPLSSRAVQHIFQAILCECRRRERTSKRPPS